MQYIGPNFTFIIGVNYRQYWAKSCPSPPSVYARSLVGKHFYSSFKKPFFAFLHIVHIVAFGIRQ